MGVSSTASLGVVVCVAICGYAVLGAVLAVSGDDAPITLTVACLAFLPVVMCLASRSSEADRGGTAYDVVRRDGVAFPLFTTGWLTLGGNLMVAALMVEAISWRAAVLAQQVFHEQLPLVLFAAPITVIAGLAETFAPIERSRARALVGWACLAAVVGVLGWIMLFAPAPPEGAALESLPSRHWLGGAAVAAAGLWFVEIVLDYRRQFQRSDRALAGVLVGSWTLTAVLTIWAATLLIEHPDLFGRSVNAADAEFDMAWVRILSFSVLIILCPLTLIKCLARATRLTAQMAADGLLPSRLQSPESQGRLPSAVLVALCALVVLLSTFADYHAMVAVAAVLFLWMAFLVVALGLSKNRGRKGAAFHLPAHPLFPLLALVACGFLSFVVPKLGVVLSAAWMAGGLLVFWLLRQRSGLQTDPGWDAEGDGQAGLDTGEPMVLACLGPASDETALIRAGVRLAGAEGVQLVVLQVLSLLEQLPRTEVRRVAEVAWEDLDARLKQAVGGEELKATSLVRIAPTSFSGVLDSAGRFNVEWILLDLPASGRGADPDQLAMVERVLAASIQPVVVVRGDLGEQPLRVLAAVSDGLDSPTVLTLGKLLSRDDGALTALHIHAPHQSKDAALQQVDVARQSAGVETTTLIVEDEDALTGIAGQAQEHDLLVMGCTRDRASRTSRGASGLWAELGDVCSGPSVLVRRKEARGNRWWNQLWDLLFVRLPTLSVGERAEVYNQMRNAASADVDYYVLIVVASAIATFGLVQDSAAVIIGAMLVAPLMSPIVAIAQGIVQGNPSMMRRGLASTLKGSAVALAVAAGFVLIIPDKVPTAQIMARTVPTLLDLGVGLAAGAAAAYGVSRKSVASALPGVAISVALVPPLCASGFGLASDRFDIFLGALVLFLTNLAAIVLVSVVVFLLLGFSPRQKVRRRQVRGAVFVNVMALTLLTIPLGISSCHVTQQEQLEVAVESVFRSQARERQFYLADVDVAHQDGLFVVKAQVYAGEDVTQDMLTELRTEVEELAGIQVRLELVVVLAKRWTAEPTGQNAVTDNQSDGVTGAPEIERSSALEEALELDVSVPEDSGR